MKIILITLVAALICAESVAVFAGDFNQVQEQKFFESLGDVPLMTGLYEIAEELVVFDKPGGRIIESAAASKDISISEIISFYNQVLPQMGWVKTAENVFVRQDESLVMNIENQDGFSVVRFMILPRL